MFEESTEGTVMTIAAEVARYGGPIKDGGRFFREHRERLMGITVVKTATTRTAGVFRIACRVIVMTVQPEKVSVMYRRPKVQQ